MRSKTILAAVIAGTLGVPLASVADDSSQGSRVPSVGASVSGNTSVQGGLGTNDPSSQTYGQNRSDRYAQNEDKDRDNDRGKARGRDDDRDHDRGRHSQNRSGQSSQYPSQSQSPSQYSSNSGNSNRRYSSSSY